VNELLTTRQLQELLKVDRTTIYRMLSHGRLTGIKIGGQWRFPRTDVEEMLAQAHAGAGSALTLLTDALPLRGLQAIQDVFAEMASIGALTTAANGEPLTRMSNGCAFCQLLLSSESGRRACSASWRSLAQQIDDHKSRFTVCHAGLLYACAPIKVSDHVAALLLAGQFRDDAQPAADAPARLAEAHGLDEMALSEAARELSALDARRREQIDAWLALVAAAFEEIGRERAALIGRLQRIAAMSALDLAQPAAAGRREASDA
jgi:excisionase family DNA binding protein